ncbi:MAG: thiamine pyrophosphate-dependent enzyme [Candidatus Anammoxibacter sp.]
MVVNHIKENLFDCGHTACSGCGEAIGARRVLQVAGKNIIATAATGCLEVFTTRYPESSWGVPFIHSLFENSAAVASGVEVALKALGRDGETKVIAQGGDGGTADIGLQALSGMFERGHDILYVCYDNEAYMNTGVQRSGLTPFDCMTSTSPPGKFSWGNQYRKKDIPAIAVAHGIPYVATSSVAFPRDIENKVKKALSITGPKYIQIHVPCPLGWRSKSELTIKIAELAVKTGLYPIYEVENGDITGTRRLFDVVPVEEYLKLQGRFAHLFKKDGGKAEIKKIQEIADENIKKFHLN